MLIFIAKLISQAKVAEILIFLDVLIHHSKYFNDNCSFKEGNNHKNQLIPRKSLF